MPLHSAPIAYHVGLQASSVCRGLPTLDRTGDALCKIFQIPFLRKKIYQTHKYTRWCTVRHCCNQMLTVFYRGRLQSTFMYLCVCIGKPSIVSSSVFLPVYRDIFLSVRKNQHSLFILIKFWILMVRQLTSADASRWAISWKVCSCWTSQCQARQSGCPATVKMF